MKLIQENPYRICGILSNATERALQKQKSKIKAYAKVGREAQSDLDFQILGSISRTQDSINKAFSNIEQNQDRLTHALFWFSDTSPFDKIAIEYLKNGDTRKATEIWEKVTTQNKVTSKNFSAFNNWATLKLLSNLNSDIKAGIEAKIELIESDFFQNFVHSVADETFIIQRPKQIQLFIDALLMEFKNQYSSSEILQLFSGVRGSAQKYLLKSFTEEPIHKIENQIQSCKNKRKANKSSAYEFGLMLFVHTKDDLSFLKSLLGKSNLKYKAIADQLADEIMQCGIDYFNESQENDSNKNYLELAQRLTKYANSIAVGELVKDRAKDNLATLEKMKDRELNQAIQVLQFIRGLNEKIGYNQSLNWNKLRFKII